MGCGPYYKRGWVNVDPYQGGDVTPDVRAALPILPFDDGCAEMVYCGHCIEHVRLWEVTDALQELERICAVGGELCLVAPDYTDVPGKRGDEFRELAVFGTGRYEGDYHEWASEASLLLYLTRNAGLEGAEIVGLRGNRSFANKWMIPDRDRYGQCCVLWKKPVEGRELQDVAV